MSYLLEKPYTDLARAEFIIAHQGLTYAEDAGALYMLEPYEILEDGKIVDASGSDDYKGRVAAAVNAARKAEIQAQLDALDAASARPLRAILAAQAAGKTAAAADLTKLTDLEAQAVDLRAELAGLAGVGG